jgi:hypothetical protein
MRLEKKYKLEKVIGSFFDPERDSVHVTSALLERDEKHPGRGFLVATNGASMVRVPVLLDDGDVPGLVPRRALEHARSLAKGKEPIILECGEQDVRTRDGARFARGDARDFPEWRRVIPALDQDEARRREEALAWALSEYTARNPESRFVLRLGINPTLLARLAEAAGEGQDGVELLVSLEPDVRRKRVLVLDPYRIWTLEPGGFAALAPARIKESE